MAKKLRIAKSASGGQEGETLAKARTELFTMKIDLHLRKLKNTRSIFFKRKEIARMLTARNMQKSADVKTLADKGGKEHE